MRDKQLKCAKCKQTIWFRHSNSVGRGLFGISYYLCNCCWLDWKGVYRARFGRGALQNMKTEKYKRAWKNLFLNTFLGSQKEVVVFT